MTITPSPIRQSCATWLRPITRHSRPMSVQPSARVERCTVTYSRMTVSAPTRTPEGAVLVLEVLGHAAEHAAVADLHARAERHAALEHGVVADLDAALQRHLGADHAEGADPHSGVEPRARVDDRRGVDRVTHRAPPCARADRRRAPPPRAPARARAGAARAGATAPR